MLLVVSLQRQACLVYLGLFIFFLKAKKASSAVQLKKYAFMSTSSNTHRHVYKVIFHLHFASTQWHQHTVELCFLPKTTLLLIAAKQFCTICGISPCCDESLPCPPTRLSNYYPLLHHLDVTGNLILSRTSLKINFLCKLLSGFHWIGDFSVTCVPREDIPADPAFLPIFADRTWHQRHIKNRD